MSLSSWRAQLLIIEDFILLLRCWSFTDFHRATGTSSLNPKELATFPSQNLHEAAGLPQDTDSGAASCGLGRCLCSRVPCQTPWVSGGHWGSPLWVEPGADSIWLYNSPTTGHCWALSKSWCCLWGQKIRKGKKNLCQAASKKCKKKPCNHQGQRKRKRSEGPPGIWSAQNPERSPHWSRWGCPEGNPSLQRAHTGAGRRARRKKQQIGGVVKWSQPLSPLHHSLCFSFPVFLTIQI